MKLVQLIQSKAAAAGMGPDAGADDSAPTPPSGGGGGSTPKAPPSMAPEPDID